MSRYHSHVRFGIQECVVGDALAEDATVVMMSTVQSRVCAAKRESAAIASSISQC